MPKSDNQKMKILYLMKIFMEETDKHNKLTANQIIDLLSSKYNIDVERKTIYSDIEILKNYGLDIKMEKTKHYQYYLATRVFEFSELKLLVDIIQSSKFITARKSNEFIKKIESMTSIYQGKKLNRHVHVNRQIKTMNESIYNNVDVIQDAILDNRKIKFQYYEYTTKKEKKFRRDGKFYITNPMFLNWDSENYYLVSFCPIDNLVKHYRVDKMINIRVDIEKIDNNIVKIDPATYTNKVFGMFSGDEHAVEIEFHNSLIDVVIDRFGKDVLILKENIESFVIHVKVEISLVFIGWLFQFGTKAKVISPQSLIEDMKTRATSLLSCYSECNK